MKKEDISKSSKLGQGVWRVRRQNGGGQSRFSKGRGLVKQRVEEVEQQSSGSSLSSLTLARVNTVHLVCLEFQNIDIVKRVLGGTSQVPQPTCFPKSDGDPV